jgi:nucleoid-associated protein Lsr2
VAQVTKVELIDDLSGDKADETVTFSLDGVVFDIDLSANNAGILRDIFEDYVNAGRKVSKPASSPARRNTL